MSIAASPAAPVDLQTVAGTHIETPTLETIRRQLEVLATSTRGSSITLTCGARSMRIKFRRDSGFDLLTYRTDFTIEEMHTAPGRVVLNVDSRSPEVECGLVLECVATFFDHATAA